MQPPQPASDLPSVPPNHPGRSPIPGLLLVASLLVIGLVVAESLVALAVLLLEGTVALAVLAAAAMAGGWLVRLIGLGDEPLAVRWILGAALGLGALSLIVLALGSTGCLSKPVAWGLVAALLIVGLVCVALDARQICRPHARGCLSDEQIDDKQANGNSHWLWLLVVPFLAITLLAACLPPGVLWAEEGFGYDVLEYHLAVPKIWHDGGRITFLPGNVYSNFPMNGEMISLLMMTLRGDAIESAYLCQIANVAQGCLFVAAAWLAGRSFSRQAGLIAAILAAATPWLAYLSAIAYVEPGMLALGMAALAALLRCTPGDPLNTRRILLAGLLAGLACGYKYTAVALIAAPLAAFLLAQQETIPAKIKHLVLFALTALATFSPWLIRNTVNTHNPVFPLAWSVFGAKDGVWDAELDARWQRAHGSARAEHVSTPTGLRAWQRTIGDQRMGYLVFGLALAGALSARDRRTLALVAMLAVQLIVWLMATHLFARFAVVLLVPLIVLAARIGLLQRKPWPALISLLLVLGAGWNLYHLWSLYYHHTRVGTSHKPVQAYAQTDWFVDGSWPGTEPWGAINRLPPDARVMLVGEARTLYIRRPVEYAVAFNHHPLALAMRQCPDPAAVVDWLRQHGTTHLLVQWGELHRLMTTYGLDPGIEPAAIERLVQAGLKPIEDFSYQEGSPPYATLFEVPRP